MIRFACPSCESVLNAPEDKAGSKGPCPKCGQRVEVPAPPRKTVLGKLLPADEAPLPSWMEPPVRAPRPAPPVEEVVNACPSCGTLLGIPRARVGQWTECLDCRTAFEVYDPASGEFLPVVADEGGREVSSRSTARTRRRRDDGEPSVAVQVNTTTIVAGDGKASNSLSVASLVVSILGFFFCWLPFIGLFFGLLGGGLGLGGLGVSISRQDRGLGFAIAGLAISLVTLTVGGYMTLVMFLR